MLTETYAFYELVLRILALLTDGAATMPLIAALTLLIGRRGHARVCIFGSGMLVRLTLFLAAAGFINFPLSCYVTLLPYNPGSAWLTAFFSLPGMPWLSSWLAWALGAVFLGLDYYSLIHLKISADQISFAEVKTPFLLMCAAALCFFLVYFLVSWPFAGLPPELSTQRVATAVLRNGFRHWFLAFSAAGAIALALAPAYLRHIDTEEKGQALRWCALWAAAASLPSSFTNWGFTIGALARGVDTSGNSPALYAQLFATACSTLALFIWLFCLWKKRAGLPACLALLFLTLKYCAPALAALFKFSPMP